MKGYVKTLEATIGAVFLLGMLIILYPYQPEPSNIDYGSVAYDCLEHLDQRNLLAKFAENNDELSLRVELGRCMPAFLEFQSKICKTIECSSELAETSTHVSTYFVSGYDNTEPAMVRVWVKAL